MGQISDAGDETATVELKLIRRVSRDSFGFRGAKRYASNGIQRCWRDLNTAGQHYMVSESAYENHGKFLLGPSDAKPFG